MVKKLLTPVSGWALVLNFLVLLTSVGLMVLHQANLPPVVPLWFSKPWGIERLAAPESLWLLPLIIGIFLMLNNFIAKILFSNHKILALILVWSALLISLIVFFPLYRILLSLI